MYIIYHIRSYYIIIGETKTEGTIARKISKTGLTLRYNISNRKDENNMTKMKTRG